MPLTIAYLQCKYVYNVVFKKNIYNVVFKKINLLGCKSKGVALLNIFVNYSNIWIKNRHVNSYIWLGV